MGKSISILCTCYLCISLLTFLVVHCESQLFQLEHTQLNPPASFTGLLEKHDKKQVEISTSTQTPQEAFTDQSDILILQHADGDQEEHRMLVYNPVEGIPYGLEPLITASEICLTTGLPLSVTFDVTVNRHYNVMNQAGQKIYHAGEHTNHCLEYCCNGHRGFNLVFFNGRGKTVMIATQKCTAELCFCSAECSGANMALYLPNGTSLGSLHQITSCSKPMYDIKDQFGKPIMRMVGPGGGVCTQLCGRKFKIFLLDEKSAPTVTICTVDKRRLTIPRATPVELKALLLAALFLIELDYYHSSRSCSKVLLLLVLLFIGALVWGFIIHGY